MSSPMSEPDKLPPAPSALEEQQDTRRALLFMLEDLEHARQQIEQVHQEWMAALDALDDPIFLHDSEFRIRRANRAYQRRAGLPFEQIIGKPYYQVFPQSAGPLAQCQHANEAHATIEEFVTAHDRIYRSRASPVFDERGQLLYSVHSLEDITEHQQMAHAIAESEALNRQLFDNSRDALVTLTPPDWRFTRANRATATLFGAASPADITRLTPWDVSPENQADGRPSREKMQAMFAAAMSEGELAFEWLHQRLDGEPFTADVLLSRMEQDGQVFLQATVRDISERKRMQQTLEQNEARFRSIIDNSTSLIYVNDLEGKFLVANRALTELLQLGWQQIIGKSREQIMPGEAAAQHRAHDLQVIRSHQPLSLEETLPLQDGLHTYLTVKFPLLQADGRVYAVAGISTDITERKRAETELRDSEGRFRALAIASADAIYRMSPDWGEMRQLAGKDFIEDTLESCRTWLGKYIPADDQAQVMSVIGQAIDGKTVFELEHRVLRTDGSIGWTHSRAVPILNAQGDITEWFGAASDITARKLAELAVLRTNRALRALSAGNQALVHAQDEDALLVEMCLQVVEKGGYLMAWVGYAQDDDEQGIKPVAQHGFAPGYLESAGISWADNARGQGPTARAIRSGQTQVVQDELADPALQPWWQRQRELGIASAIALPLFDHGHCFGTFTLYHGEKNAFDAHEISLLEEIAGDLAYGIHTLRIKKAHEEHDLRLRENMLQTIQSIAGIVEMRDPYTSGHQARVAELARAIGRKLGLPEEELEAIHLAGLVHDLGKVRMPAEILSKPGRLNTIEFSLIKMHPEEGYNILKNIKFPWPIAKMVLQHHERMDGSGYPRGLKGDDILLGARILCVADVAEAMASHRPYRPGLGVEAALAELQAGRGTMYDAMAVDACMLLFKEEGYAFGK